MDLRYEAFCFADPLFFDEQRDTGTTDDTFCATLSPPDDWKVTDLGGWRMWCPPDAILPAQGWKIHVSTTLDTAAHVLEKVHCYCIRRKIAFKYLRTPTILLIRNSKYAEREGSGKFITVYPADEKMLHEVLDDLAEALAGATGPYILSDLRYRNGPLYVRYGGFVQRWVESGGTRVLAIAKPDGTLVPDRREPTFSTPEWVELPEFLKPQLAARKAGDPAQFPYRIETPLHFSNGGGVYLATRNSDGARLVLKEGRPHAGLDRDGTDAIERLHREHHTLALLADIPGIPQVYDRFTVWEHEFLAMQHLPGIPLGRWLALNYPLSKHDRTQADLAGYTKRALAMLDQVATLLEQVHRLGLVFGDLHGQNILVDSTEDGTERAVISLIDFELAFPVSKPASPALGAPGFRAPADRTGFEIDDYALAALRLWTFLPLNTILELAPARLDTLIGYVQRRFPVPAGFGDDIRAQLAPRTGQPGRARIDSAAREIDQPAPDWGVVRKSIGEAILASATPHRRDRLFPGDIEQFRVGGSCFGFGAAGVLYALEHAGLGRYPEHERWLLDAVRRTPPNRPGFMDGAHGIGYVLERFGYRDEASELLESAAGLVEQTTDHDLHGGLAGIALTRLYLAGQRDDPSWLRRAVELAERLADALAVAAPPGAHGRAGLAHGWSGPAVLFTRLFGHTRQQRWLKLADRALSRDLDEVTPANDGSLQVRDGIKRTLPYLGIGSAGIVAAAELLAEHAATLSDPGCSEFGCLRQLPGLRKACHGELTAFSGLVYGRAGLLAALAMTQRRDPNPATSNAIDVHLRGLGMHAVPYRDQTAFVGNMLLRLSMDVNTGGAGVLLALAAVQDGHGTAMPFLEPPLDLTGQS
jgi:Lipopolysaccharide kinase (Kdo/WaaP) family